jgi:hypothetical protein
LKSDAHNDKQVFVFALESLASGLDPVEDLIELLLNVLCASLVDHVRYDIFLAENIDKLLEVLDNDLSLIVLIEEDLSCVRYINFRIA